MLATILKSNIAIKVSIAIMDAFVSMRSYISSNLLEQKYINNYESVIDKAKLACGNSNIDNDKSRKGSR